MKRKTKSKAERPLSKNKKLFNTLFAKKRYTVVRLEIGLLLLILGLFRVFDARTATVLRAAAFVACGFGVIIEALKDAKSGRIFSENVLMSVSGIVAVLIGEIPEGVLIMLLFEIGEFFQDYAVERSRASISDLIDLSPKSVTVIKDGELCACPAEEVSAGDRISIAPGEIIPVDGVVIKGESTLDTAAVTGESLPKDCGPGDMIYSGCINTRGSIIIEAGVNYSDSTAAKMKRIVEKAEAKKSARERMITKFCAVYTPAVFLLAFIIGILVPLFGAHEYSKWIYRGLVILVVSCPCALVISVPLTYFAGIGGASRRGILFKSTEAVDTAAQLTSVIFDKTGTLSTGKFEVIDVVPEEGITTEDLLRLAVSAEMSSKHPIARSICEYAGIETDASWVQKQTEIRGKGSVVTLKNSRMVYAGNAELMEDIGAKYFPAPSDVTSVYIAVGTKYAGRIDLVDMPKKDAEEAVSGLRREGVVNVALMTGDNALAATRIGKEVGISEIYADCLPQDKVDRVEYLIKLQNADERLAFVGDGINDVPVLASADIGIAMGGLGSDAAIEASDVVIMTDEPSKMIQVISSAKKISRIVTQNTVAALAVKALVMILGICGAAPMWLAVFADSGVMLLAVMNAMRALK